MIPTQHARATETVPTSGLLSLCGEIVLLTSCKAYFKNESTRQQNIMHCARITFSA